MKKLLVGLALLLCALAPGQGINLSLPSTEVQPGWERQSAIVASLPKGTTVRLDLLWHQTHWQRAVPTYQNAIREKLRLVAPIGGRIVCDEIPHPWPGCWGWTTFGPWGYVSEDEFPEIASAFAYDVSLVRGYARELGIREDRIEFDLGNEMASGHPGGWAALPTGEVWERHAKLYAACLAKAKFGKARVIGPAFSMLDHQDPERSRNLSGGARLYKLIRSRVDYADVHHRLYAPQLTSEQYAAEWLRLLDERMKQVADLTGRPCVCTEAYCFEGDTPDRAAVMRLIVPKLPQGVTLWGPGIEASDGSGMPLSFALPASNVDSGGKEGSNKNDVD